jgi:hypothetical protein
MTGSKTAVSETNWLLKEWNEDATFEWYSTGAKFNASINSLVQYKILLEDPSNYTYPNSGLLDLGNLTNYETDNSDIANSLTFSIWPWTPGLVTHTNWTDHKLDAVFAANGQYLQGTLLINSQTTYNTTSFSRTAIKFDYTQNKSLGNQNTSLIYDYETGVLLYGYSEINFFTPYIIELEFLNSSLITSSNVQSTDPVTVTKTFGTTIIETETSSRTSFNVIFPLVMVIFILASINIRKRE